MTPKLIGTLKTSIYTPKHTPNTKIYFQHFKMFKQSEIHICSKSLRSKTSAFFADLHGPPLAGLKF